VNPALTAIAALTIAAAVVAVAARDPRATVLGLLVVFLAAPLVATPWPGPLPVLARIAAALLAARLLMIGLRGDARGAGTGIGWPAEALAGAAAAVVGFGSHGLGAAGLGPAEAQAAGFALAAIAIAPLVTGRDVLRIGVGSLLLVQAALLVRQALDRPATDAEQLVEALLTIGLGGAVAVIAAAAEAGGSLTVADERGRSAPARRRPTEARRDAHRVRRRTTTEPEVAVE
jgi:hypothetical protein